MELSDVKPGDRVRLIRDDHPLKAGAVGTVDHIDTDGMVGVWWDGLTAGHGMYVKGRTDGRWMWPNEIKLVKRKTRTVKVKRLVAVPFKTHSGEHGKYEVLYALRPDTEFNRGFFGTKIVLEEVKDGK